MTTIAYRDGVLCADGQSTAGPYRMPGTADKIAMGPRGLGAACGSASFCQEWLSWIRGDREEMPVPEKPEADQSEAGILVHRDGRLELFEHNGSHFPEGDYFADGTGLPIALGAFHMGASAEEAIAAAIAHDVYSGGLATVLRIQDIPASISQAA